MYTAVEMNLDYSKEILLIPMFRSIIEFIKYFSRKV